MSKRNKPVATLIKQYCDKKSGKVGEARRELHWRFSCLDWSQQKKIIMAHLDSCPSDRDWIYPQLLRLWDESFEPKVKELWETYKEPRCAWLVIRHFPESYVMEHLDELMHGRNYYFICLRFGKKDDFVIDKEKLKPFDYLTVMNMSYREMTDEDALDCLYRIVLHELRHPSFNLSHTYLNCEEHPSLNLIRDISQSLFYLRQMEKFDCVEQFERWNSEVSKHAAPAVRDLQSSMRSYSDYVAQLYSALMDSAAECLPKKYKDIRLNEIIRDNESMSDLVSRLGLEEELPKVAESDFYPF